MKMTTSTTKQPSTWTREMFIFEHMRSVLDDNSESLCHVIYVIYYTINVYKCNKRDETRSFSMLFYHPSVKFCILESLYIVEDNGDGTFSIVWDEDGEDYVSEARYSGARSLH